MRDKELPLVGFTVLSQLSVGLCLAAVPLALTDMPHAGIRLFNLFGASLGTLALAMLVSLAHLGRPLGSVRTLANLKTSWLSREIAAFGGFGLLVMLNLALIQTGGAPWPLCILAAAVMGMAALYASARIYATPSYPALDNALPFAFFLASALVLGPAFATPLAGPADRRVLIVWLCTALTGGGILHLAAPLYWLRGGRSMRLTGRDMLRAPLFRLRMAVGFALPLIVLAASGSMPLWLAVLLLAAEGAGRVLFFSHVGHTAETIGQAE